MRLLVVLLAGCSTTTPAEFVPLRPAGVTLCYSAQVDQLPSTRNYWTVMPAADYASRPAALASLNSAAQTYPSEEEAALLNGLGNLWRLVEPTAAEAADMTGFIAAALTARSEVQRAFDLCPTDYRIPAWLGPILVNTGRQLNDQATIDQGIQVLQVGIDHDPSFVLFSKLLIYADRPAGDPEFQMALDAVDANIGACGDFATTRDPACRNSAHALHNIEGASVFLGDVYAKAGRREDALHTYHGAEMSPDYASWPFRDLLQKRISDLDARLAAYAAGDEPEAAWTSTTQCSVCHKK